MTNMKYLFGRIIVTVVTVFGLASCEPTYVDVYIKNATSQNIIFKGSVGECYNLEGVLLFTEDSIMVKSGEKALVIQYKDYEGFSGDYGMPWLMGCTYPNGITIEFEDGESFEYKPDSSGLLFNSPYDKKSFFFHELDYEVEATYMVLY